MNTSAPSDMVAWAAVSLALASGVLGLSARIRKEVEHLAPRVKLAACALLAASLSIAYIYFYLGGDARVIDATSYRLQAKLFASGQLTLKPEGPTGAFLGRFLVPVDGGLAVIFPPGYAAFLSLFTFVGVPLWSGPLVASAIVVATYQLALTWFGSSRLALTAALTSALCATLRYHTADTMSHGFCALLLLSSLLAISRGKPAWAGLACGWLILCRPLSGLIVTFGCLLLMKSRRRQAAGTNSLRSLGRFAAPLTLSATVYLGYQALLTGELFSSAQHRYYALADGPVGCFSFGLGPQIGCTYEHGDFLKQYMPNGYGVYQALSTTFRRLSLHAHDALNGALIWLGVLALLIIKRRSARLIPVLDLRQLACILVFAVLYVSAYAGFYFDGNYPGGGARMFSELLPLEHLLFALALYKTGMSRFAAPLLLLGFGLSAAPQHRALSERLGGAPMHDEKLTQTLPVEPAILFANTDHGFNLAWDPARRTLVEVARLKHDAFDYALWEHRGRPAAYKYIFDPYGGSSSKLIPYTPTNTHVFEAESSWPLHAAISGWGVPATLDCASGGRVLTLTPARYGAPFTIRVELWTSHGGTYELTAVANESLSLGVGEQAVVPGLPGARPTSQSGNGCESFRRFYASPVKLRAGPQSVRVSVHQSAMLDALELRPIGP